MASRSILPEESRVDITLSGRHALLESPTCDCSQLWISEGCYRCAVCDTIYGVVFGFTVLPRRLGRRTGQHG